MKTVIVLGVLAILILLLSRWFESLDKEPENLIQAFGIVDGIIYDETGHREYFIKFLRNGDYITEKTVSYTPSSKRLNEGDEVLIKYYLTPKGKVRVLIDDENIKACYNTLKPTANLLKKISVILFIITGILLVMNVI